MAHYHVKLHRNMNKRFQVKGTLIIWKKNENSPRGQAEGQMSPKFNHSVV